MEKWYLYCVFPHAEIEIILDKRFYYYIYALHMFSFYTDTL